MDLVQTVVSTLCRHVATPRALSVHLLVQAGEWAQLQELRCEPSRYTDAESYWKDCLVTDILRKCDLDSGVDREQAAIDTFLLCEKQCASTNARLSRYLDNNAGPFDSASELSVLDFISRWRKEVSRVLGNLPQSLTPRFSGGATYGDSGRLTTIPDKMTSVPTITDQARSLLPFWDGTSWERSLRERLPTKHTPRSVRGNKFFTVPKDGKTRRGCCKEPSLNISFQLDVGRVMKNRLRDVLGIDLRAGQETQRAKARLSSSTGHLATLDMSNASDTVCRVLVDLVVRPDWAELLKTLRSSHTRLNGRWYRLEKFSSMGNGFTFELESLLFVTLAITLAKDMGVPTSEIGCYGDDLIVPTEMAKDLLSALRFFGFTPNQRKSFLEGPFRESCGGDFYNGVPVRAHFLQELPDEPQKWISLANGLRRSATQHGAPPSRWDIVRGAWRRCVDSLPAPIRRCRGPESLGDIVLHDVPETWSVWRGDRAPGQWSRCDSTGWDALWVRAYTPIHAVTSWMHWHPSVQLACCTLGLPSQGVTPRGAVIGYRYSWVIANLGSDWLPNNS